ncbi:MAG: hypothetical protein U1E31_01140 [Rickettsiales bacterium]
MLLLIFVIFGLGVVESQLFKQCKFINKITEKDIIINSQNIKTSKKTFEIDLRPESYANSLSLESCKSSIAVQINNKSASNFNLGKLIFMLLPFLMLLWILRGFIIQIGNYISNSIK